MTNHITARRYVPCLLGVLLCLQGNSFAQLTLIPNGDGMKFGKYNLHGMKGPVTNWPNVVCVLWNAAIAGKEPGNELVWAKEGVRLSGRAFVIEQIETSMKPGLTLALKGSDKPSVFVKAELGRDVAILSPGRIRIQGTILEVYPMEMTSANPHPSGLQTPAVGASIRMEMSIQGQDSAQFSVVTESASIIRTSKSRFTVAVAVLVGISLVIVVLLVVRRRRRNMGQ